MCMSCTAVFKKIKSLYFKYYMYLGKKKVCNFKSAFKKGFRKVCSDLWWEKKLTFVGNVILVVNVIVITNLSLILDQNTKRQNRMENFKWIFLMKCILFMKRKWTIYSAWWLFFYCYWEIDQSLVSWTIGSPAGNIILWQSMQAAG